MIRNYTSEVPASRSIQRIEERLVRHGARNIMKEFDDKGRMTGIFFMVEKNGKSFPFKLPARVEKVEAIFIDMRRKTPTEDQRQKIREQAERTAWKIVGDWIDVQMSLLQLEQAEFMEIFLPYAYDPATKRTLFERAKEGGFKLLAETT